MSSTYRLRFMAPVWHQSGTTSSQYRADLAPRRLAASVYQAVDADFPAAEGHLGTGYTSRRDGPIRDPRIDTAACCADPGRAAGRGRGAAPDRHPPGGAVPHLVRRPDRP